MCFQDLDGVLGVIALGLGISDADVNDEISPTGLYTTDQNISLVFTQFLCKVLAGNCGQPAGVRFVTNHEGDDSLGG
jgi:hypothetical protein